MKNLFPFLMLLFFLGILTGSNLLLSRRIGWIFSIENLLWLHILFAVVPVFMIAGLIGLSNKTGTAGHLLYGFAAILTGAMLYLVLSFVLLELVHLVIPLQPKVYGTAAFGLTLVISLYGIWNATQTRLREIEIPTDGLQSEVRIMQFSDVHIGHFRSVKFMQKLVDMAKAGEPDFVVITGDLFDGRYHLSLSTLEPLKQFDIPVYFVEGNHDGYTGVKQIKQMLRETGVRVLENEVVAESGISLAGLDHMRADADSRTMHAMQDGSTIRQVLDGMKIDPDRPSVLLHHSPDGVNYASDKGIDLYLAGHTHAGQLFPITYVNDLIFKYNRGLNQYNGTYIYVSPGAGTFGPPMRVGTSGEITLIRLIGS